MFRSPKPGRAPLVSVVMPVYEPHPEYFRKAVESILAQRFIDWELIIVEDPSDRSAEPILRRFRDPRVRYFANLRRTSLVDQRNRGFREARGGLIALMDSDDIAHPFRLIKQVNFLDSHPEADVVGSQVSVIDTDDRVVGYRQYPTLHAEILRLMPRMVPLAQPSVMLRRQVIESFGGYRFVEFPAAEDYEYWSRLVQAGIRFANLPEPLYYYRVHRGQIYRDGRDVALSLTKVPWMPKDLYVNFFVWLHYYRIQRQFLRQEPQRGFCVRYEDLVRNPKAELKPVLEFLGLDYEPAVAEGSGNHAGVPDYELSYKGGALEPISPKRIGTWRREMSPKVIARLERWGGWALRELGYECVTDCTKRLPLWFFPTLYGRLAGEVAVRTLKRKVDELCGTCFYRPNRIARDLPDPEPLIETLEPAGSRPPLA